jgi:hypothetical protein
MQQIIVNERAIRELFKEALNGRDPSRTSSAPSKVSDVVDKSAILTNPGNPNYRPDSYEELQVAFGHMLDDVPQDKIPDTYKRIVGMIQDFKGEKGKDSMKKNNTKVEAILRAHVRKIIRENRTLLEALPGDPRRGGRREGSKGEYMTVDDEGMGISDIAMKMGKSVGGVHRDITKGMEKYEKASWMYATSPAEMNEFKIAGREFLNKLETKALKMWESDPMDDGGDSFIKSEDAMKLASDPNVVRGIDNYVDYWFPENIADPEDMVSEEELEELRANPEVTVTMPGFFIAFLNDYLSDNFELLDTLRTFIESDEYKKVFNKLEKKYGKSDKESVRKGVKSTLRDLAASRPE